MNKTEWGLPRHEVKQNSQSMRRASVAQRWLDLRRDSVVTCSSILLASQLLASQAAATCSELCLRFRATQRRCNFARAAIAHGVHVARASSKSCVILQLTGQLHDRLLYACGGHAIVTRADATCSCTAWLPSYAPQSILRRIILQAITPTTATKTYGYGWYAVEKHPSSDLNTG